MSPNKIGNNIMKEQHMQVETYSKNSFDVKAVRVTEENLSEVASWCGGQVTPVGPPTVNISGPNKRRIQVPVLKPMKPRPTYAYVGDWVLDNGRGSFKVYPDKAFHENFTAHNLEEKRIESLELQGLHAEPDHHNTFNGTVEPLHLEEVSAEDSISGKR